MKKTQKRFVCRISGNVCLRVRQVSESGDEAMSEAEDEMMEEQPIDIEEKRKTKKADPVWKGLVCFSLYSPLTVLIPCAATFKGLHLASDSSILVWRVESSNSAHYFAST